MLLHRALHHVHFSEGFYIDVGGFHPTWDSVTRHFYDHGWHGVNVEPSVDLFPQFVAERTRDINLQVAVSDVPGDVTFHNVEGQLGTLVDRFAERHASAGFATRSYTVPAMTLTQICEQYAPKDINFLKIDIEGHEGAALRGMDFNRFRLWIMVIEATEPNNVAAPTIEEWDPLVCSSGYSLAYTDVLNRYYVANEHPELVHHFSIPADHYHFYRNIREMEVLQSRLGDVERALTKLRLETAGKLEQGEAGIAAAA